MADRDKGKASFRSCWIALWGWEDLGLDPTFVIHSRATSQAADSSSVKEGYMCMICKTQI